MSTQSLALSAPDAVSEEDYQAFLAALSANARGRALLNEHARRSRQTDTAALLEAMARIEAQLASQPSRADLADELNALAESVRGISSQIDAVQLTAAVGKLAATLETMQQRFSAVAVTPAPNPQREAAPASKPVEAPFALALTAVAAQALAAAQGEEPVKIIRAGTIPPPPPFAGEDFTTADTHDADENPASQNEPAMPPSDAGQDVLTQIKALSEEERLALFS